MSQTLNTHVRFAAALFIINNNSRNPVSDELAPNPLAAPSVLTVLIQTPWKHSPCASRRRRSRMAVPCGGCRGSIARSGRKVHQGVCATCVCLYNMIGIDRSSRLHFGVCEFSFLLINSRMPSTRCFSRVFAVSDQRCRFSRVVRVIYLQCFSRRRHLFLLFRVL